ncbi:MAG: hypothetical protein ACD_65C00193G0001 [uncultured bacterium]|nr:MAG: hypothetical protein ACD_65C00193G0001 [uncultured bacterium]KKT02207.1 MAG: hypothetical protein UV80_C0005G0052 [Candidatus Peregrinibacteria bacterium GW2011_GWF2_43_17]KKT19678.1 MAG: hypothetical protein UW03_C0015G0054 [Candidatus Peregrinibacteria bacterium GW2011_GWA2_43_8]HAU40032.1 hypothetical protein [Candidatus Peregrinibacteria bacterium]
MFKPNRLVWKEKAASKGLNNLTLAQEASAESSKRWARILGRFTKKLSDGADRAAIGSVEVAGRTAYEIIRHTTQTARGLVRNTLAPLTVLDSDKTFWAKTWDALKEVPYSVVGRNLGNIGYGLAGIGGSLLGVGFDKEKKLPTIRRSVGLAGLGWKLLGGSKDVATSLYGADAINAHTEAAEDDADMHETIGARVIMFPGHFRAKDAEGAKKTAATTPKKKEEKKAA